MKIRALLLIIGTWLATGCTTTLTDNPDPVEQKINNLLSEMTLDEKIGQMQQVNDGFFGDEEATKQAIRDGKVGSFLNTTGADRVAEFQRVALEESKHGIPLLFGRDVIHGYRTIFPIPLGMASSWEPELAEKAMRIAAVEASSMGINWTFAPMMDVTWDPRWGRIAESCGEDPLLTSEFAAAMVKGFQGDLGDPTAVAACAKHFVGYGMSEAGRDYNTTYIPEPLLRNVHLRPFKAAADAGALTFMSAFNDLNGVPTSGNEFTLKQILRNEWDYKGMVVSDWGSIEEMINHGFAADKKQAAEIAAKAGVDMEMATTCYADNLKTLIEEGVITEDMIETYVGNILRVKFKLGLFDKPYDNHVSTDTILAPSHLAVSREAARKSMVLLKNNNNTLPISKNIHSLAVIGPLADAARDQLGTWIFDGQGEDSTTPKQAFGEILGAKMNYVPGLEYSRDKSTKGFAEAVAAAKRSDAILFFAGEESILSGEANARGIIDLPGVQTELITELRKTGKPLILVVMAGRPLGIGAEMEMADAVLYAWHPGTMAGPAVADLIFGDYSPSGKLPVTFVKGAGQIPFYYYRKNTGRPATKDDVTYIDDIPRNSKQLSLGFKSMHIDYGVTPLLPFGFGLSYTEFEYENLKLSSNEMATNGSITVSADIKNIGNFETEEIVQLYVHDKVGSITRPIKELKGFEKINLKPGDVKTISFELKAEDLQFFNGDDYVIEPGDFEVWIGPNSDEGLKGAFMLK
ncbi:beta-glucosidase BglX [uncultured Draconibacterium sp.]|uniref:beta-glucosidase BglX n=1 Tax=uncultured Draconibacterium sp. TaxID=1573823 RepID=UPI0029C8129A|nr:beta-glucosidase BglX [uncultured Draconibacterium sp.]